MVVSIMLMNYKNIFRYADANINFISISSYKSRNIFQVDIYGSCGSFKCSRNIPNKCFEILNRDYKFYLAFENSNCKDYITEKFFVNALNRNILPIVMGKYLNGTHTHLNWFIWWIEFLLDYFFALQAQDQKIMRVVHHIDRTYIPMNLHRQKN